MSYSYAELIERAISYAKPTDHPSAPRWRAVMGVFHFGSTSARKLCERFGYDPDEMLQGSDEICPMCIAQTVGPDHKCAECGEDYTDGW
jgi:hypothetical protein